jgi:hypothetical protein
MPSALIVASALSLQQLPQVLPGFQDCSCMRMVQSYVPHHSYKPTASLLCTCRSPKPAAAATACMQQERGEECTVQEMSSQGMGIGQKAKHPPGAIQEGMGAGQPHTPQGMSRSTRRGRHAKGLTHRGVLAMMKLRQVQCLVCALSQVELSTWSILLSAPTKYDSKSGLSRMSLGRRCGAAAGRGQHLASLAAALALQCADPLQQG